MNIETKTAQDVQDLIQGGQFNQAVDAAKEVLQHQPDDVFCLSVVAQSEFNEGQLEAAKATLLKAVKLEPHELNINRNLGLIDNRLGHFESSFNYFLTAIENNKEHPELLIDFMLLAISLARMDEAKAVEILEWVFYVSNRMQSAYQDEEVIPLLREASKIANIIVRNYRFHQQKSELDAICLGFTKDKTQRLEDFLDIFHGLKDPVVSDELQHPTYHAFPGLPSHPFYDTEEYSWVSQLEDNADNIRSELLNLFKNEELIRPYIDGVITGVEGLDELADSYDWSSVHLIKGGDKRDDLLQQCPVTNQVLESLPLAVLEGNGPEVFLSVLKPGTEIKPHFGLSNIKLTVHLGLDVPSENCSIKVGDETQSWENNKVLIFDDTFQHSAWNHSEQNRYVLILEVWHPELTELEKQGLQKFQFMQDKIMKRSASHDMESILDLIKS